MQSDDVSYELLRKKCSDESFHCFGTGYIFDKRAFTFGKWLNLLKVFGILTPSMVGITAISYEYKNHKELLSTCISIAIIILIIQFGFSVLAIIYKWDDELAYAYEASQDYSDLHDSFKRLAELPPNSYVELAKSYELLNSRYRLREQQDTKHNIKEWELRRGMRWALREFKIPCYGCKKEILSMKSEECDVCGKFSRIYRL